MARPVSYTHLYMKHKTAMKNNLIGILDQNYPGVNTYFDSPARSDGSHKWVDFASTYWHVDCVRKMSLNAFIDHYQNWCKRKKYNFSQSKAEEIYGKAKELVPVLSKDAITKLIICLLYTSHDHQSLHTYWLWMD